MTLYIKKAVDGVAKNSKEPGFFIAICLIYRRSDWIESLQCRSRTQRHDALWCHY